MVSLAEKNDSSQENQNSSIIIQILDLQRPRQFISYLTCNQMSDSGRIC